MCVYRYVVCTHTNVAYSGVFFFFLYSFALRVRHNTNSACILGVFCVADPKRIRTVHRTARPRRYAVAKRPNYHNNITLLLLPFCFVREKHRSKPDSGRTHTRDCSRHVARRVIVVVVDVVVVVVVVLVPTRYIIII